MLWFICAAAVVMQAWGWDNNGAEKDKANINKNSFIYSFLYFGCVFQVLCFAFTCNLISYHRRLPLFLLKITMDIRANNAGVWKLLLFMSSRNKIYLCDS